MLLTDIANIGILVICKNKSTLTAEGKVVRRPTDNTKIIPDGLPAIIPVDLYELAQVKLKANKNDKSHIHRNPEDFLLKGHIYCKTCGYKMHGRYMTSRNSQVYTYYGCIKYRNRYDACPELPVIRTDKVEELVWEDCCRVFERIEAIRSTIESNIEQSLQNLLEDTAGKLLVAQLKGEIAYAEQEQAKHAKGRYYYQLISHDITQKQEQLARYEEEERKTQDIVKLTRIYRESVMGFFDFLSSMKGKYHQAAFKEKRNAFDVLGAKVYIHPDTQELPIVQVETDKEWLTVDEAAELSGVSATTLYVNIRSGSLGAEYRGDPARVIHRSQVIKYLGTMRRKVSLDGYEDEWFTVNRLVVNKIANYHPLHHAIRLGIIETHMVTSNRPFIHRDELNRFLRESPVQPKPTIESVQHRIEITYTPIFTGVQSTLG